MTPYCVLGLGVACIALIRLLCLRSEVGRIRDRNLDVWRRAGESVREANRRKAGTGTNAKGK